MPKEDVLFRFALKVKKERSRRGLTQEQFAEMLGFHRTYIGMLERGERSITLVNAEKIASGLGMELKTLFDFDDEA